MVTRRVHKRQLLLIENEKVRQIIEYTLGYCLMKHNVKLHAIVVEGNHIHRVDTDIDGLRPEFIRDFHSFLARQLNQYHEEADAFFSNKPTNIVDNADNEDVLNRIVYTMGNPVADGIEREGKNHKGIRMRWPQPDKVIQRPTGFWRPIEKGGIAPEEVTLHFSRPPGWKEATDEELDEIIEKRVLEYEKLTRDERLAAGKGFLCDCTNKRPDPRSFPKSPHKLFGLMPLIGAALKENRLDRIARLREFRKQHEVARLLRKGGEHNVVFPHGTYLAVQRWKVAVAPAPT